MTPSSALGPSSPSLDQTSSLASLSWNKMGQPDMFENITRASFAKLPASLPVRKPKEGHRGHEEPLEEGEEMFNFE
ncbi:uncharacterized protein N7515_009298 [Penicillium bovifimosum]|uniref:Uncharacterized protein n=1 Tax=Penicillium bovifimosum TaxID=126998 RepID=A0A9W9GJ10_9EURO|nr:uncharacterized protein N7515_009298 [Penicillium bovifimosum]KAJ5121337.1 hypothetical protein N7515_009298 [Penicillium bovifimosum]